MDGQIAQQKKKEGEKGGRWERSERRVEGWRRKEGRERTGDKEEEES